MDIQTMNYNDFMSSIDEESPQDYATPISPKSGTPFGKQPSVSPNYSSDSSLSPIYYTSDHLARRHSLADTVRLNQAQTFEIDTNLKDKGKVIKKKPIPLKSKLSFDEYITKRSPPSQLYQSFSETSPIGFKSNEEKAFQCTQCSLSFRRNHDLKRHLKIHLPVRPYVCKFCSKGFNRKDALRRHLMSNACKMNKSNTQDEKIVTHLINSNSNDSKPIANISDPNITALPAVLTPLSSSFVLSPSGTTSPNLNSTATTSYSRPKINDSYGQFMRNNDTPNNGQVSNYISFLIERAKLEKENQRKFKLQHNNNPLNGLGQQNTTDTSDEDTDSASGHSVDAETHQLLQNFEFVISKLAEKQRSRSQVLKHLSLPGNDTNALVEKLLDIYNSTQSTPNDTTNSISTATTNSASPSSSLSTNYFEISDVSNKLIQPNIFEDDFNDIMSQSTDFNNGADSLVLGNTSQQNASLLFDGNRSINTIRPNTLTGNRFNDSGLDDSDFNIETTRRGKTLASLAHESFDLGKTHTDFLLSFDTHKSLTGNRSSYFSIPQSSQHSHHVG